MACIVNSDVNIYLGTPSSEVGLIGSIFFVGWACSAPFISRLADLIGRKKTLFIAMVGTGGAYLGIMLC